MVHHPRVHHPRVVVVGAGIVGCALADELTARGWRDVTVLEQGPLFTTGGSTSHAPGLVFQTNVSRTMTGFARYTVDKYGRLKAGGRACFDSVGGLELATSAERMRELRRRHGLAASWGLDARLLDPPECAALHPLLEPGPVLGGLHVRGDGLARAVPAAEAQARLATARGARFLADRRVVGIESSAGAVTAVHTERETFPADVVVSCAGFWGPAIGALAGVTVPLLPMAHQYARSGPLTALAGRGAGAPILRHQDRDLYFRLHGDRVGVGSYAHRPMPVDLAELAEGAHPSMLGFTRDDFAESWSAAQDLLPALRGASLEEGFNGVFSFTPDGFPLLGESRQLRGFWTAEAVWVTHSAGAARAVAEWLVDGRPGADLHECDLNRFDSAQLTPSFVRQRATRSFVEVYDIVHPLDPPGPPRAQRVSPWHARQAGLGAVFTEAGGWERPLWYEANAGLPQPARGLRRDPWSARNWSPIVAAEARATRDSVALYDMTPLTRLEVAGPAAAAYLQRLASNDVDRPVGTVVYALLLDHAGGIRSDITVARLGEELFQVGVNGPLDLDWLLRHRPADGSVSVRDVTGGTGGLGVWGPRARDLIAPLADIDVSHQAFGYFRARRAHLGDVPVTMLRLSYVGELGWEIYTSAEHGLRLWDTLWEAGAPLGLIAAGRGAFTSLRLEKGYRAWGADMTTEDDPYEAGLGFAVRSGSGDFIGRDALAGRSPSTARRLLTCLLLDDRAGEYVPLGREPVYVGGAPVGYVTSAAYGYTVGAPIAYAWLPPAVAVPGTAVRIDCLGRMLPATVTSDPVFDPKHERIRR
ncbi:FAD-dependent oxidoreductase [Actinoplanes sp. NPDC049316]|uniref:GcvT family protein n=1 Tax=Actinoplanes sp. NPDC049316 TaxID=3154727 RepID=UPI003419B991